MSLLDKEDWTNWLGKLKWQLISFKFLAFWTFIFLLIGAWLSLKVILLEVIERSTALYKLGYLTKEGLATIITHTETVLYDSALSHVLLFSTAVITGILAIKGVSYYTDGKSTSEVIKKLDTGTSNADLKKFLPKQGK